MTESEIKRLVALIQSGQEHLFYVWSKWLKKREEVLRLDRHECQLCKRRGRYRRAEIVHHVEHLKQRPELALSVWKDEERTARQLISVCKRCHEEEHPESMRQYKKIHRPITEERWD